MKKICFAVLAFTLALPALAGTIEYNNPTTGAISAAVVADGRLRVDNSHPTKFNAILANSSATTATEIKAAPGAGLSLYVSDLHVSGSAAATVTANQQLILVYGTGTNCGTGQAVIFSCYNAALGSCVLNLSTPVKIPANNALCFLSAVTGSKSAAVSGFTAP